nr:hypothetical protein [Actinomycetota bacterium]
AQGRAAWVTAGPAGPAGRGGWGAARPAADAGRGSRFSAAWVGGVMTMTGSEEALELAQGIPATITISRSLLEQMLEAAGAAGHDVSGCDDNNLLVHRMLGVALGTLRGDALGRRS